MFSSCIYTLYLVCIHALPKWEGYLSTPSPLSSASSSFWNLYFNLKSTFECISVGLPAFACISLIWLGRDTQLGSTGQKLSRSVLEGNDDHFDEGWRWGGGWEWRRQWWRWRFGRWWWWQRYSTQLGRNYQGRSSPPFTRLPTKHTALPMHCLEQTPIPMAMLICINIQGRLAFPTSLSDPGSAPIN